MSRRKSFLADATITRGALILLIASSAVSLLYLLASGWFQAEMSDVLSATGASLWQQGRVWQVVTSPMLEPSFVSLLFQGLMLWMFLPTLERWWGMKRFLRFALYTSVTGVAVGSLVGVVLGGEYARVPLHGLDPFVFAALLAFGVLYAAQPVKFFGAIPMTGRQLAIGIIGVTAVLLVLGQRWVEGAANASAMLLAYVMTSTRSSPKLLWLKWKQKRIRSRLGVVDGGKKDPKWMN
jgi:membrane associated rhomboid family serine protease